MICKVNKYLNPNKFFYDMRDSDDMRLSTVINMSSGVSYIGLSDLYRQLLSNEMIYSNEFTNYVPDRGSILARKVITYYERWLAGINDDANDYFNNVCINCGSTEAIAHIFSYLKEKEVDKILLVGLQYFAYEMLANQYNITSYLLMSSEEDKIIPTIQDVKRSIEQNGIRHVFLTLPMNPSGEKYTCEEFTKLLEICKKNDCILFIDKCQLEEFEEVDSEYDYHLGECIKNTCSYNSIIILDSFSKKRNIPGLRIGYVAGANDVIEYLEYMNYITCCHHSVVAIAPIVIDYYYRIICTENDIGVLQKVQKDFRKMILMEANIDFARYLLKFIKSPQKFEKAHEFIDEIKHNNSVYKENYDYACERLKKAGIVHSKRIGGFNFSILYNNDLGYSEKDFKDYLKKQSSIFICTQEDFCDHTERENNKFWIRITLAESIDTFRTKFDKFIKFITDQRNENYEKSGTR